MYHGLALLLLSVLPAEEKSWISKFFIGGTVLFSFSIFFSLSSAYLKTQS
jgi:uncharacterized membrane protein YgdD (TMEM256/DUF423 family)